MIKLNVRPLHYTGNTSETTAAPEEKRKRTPLRMRTNNDRSGGVSSLPRDAIMPVKFDLNIYMLHIARMPPLLLDPSGRTDESTQPITEHFAFQGATTSERIISGSELFCEA